MWQLTRTLVCSSYEPNLRVYLKYKSSVAVNKGDWQLGPCLHIAWPSPAGDLHVLLEVGVQQLWLSGGRRGSEASMQPTAGLVGQDHPRCPRHTQSQSDSAKHAHGLISQGQFSNSFCCCHKEPP